MAAPALSRGRGGAAVPSERGGNHGQGWPIAHEPVLRVPRGAGTEASQEGAVRRDRRRGRRDARDADWPDGWRRDGGGCAPRPRARLPPGGAQARRGRRGGQAGGRAGARPCRASGTMSGVPLRAGTGRRGRGATTRAPSAPASRPSGRHVRRQPDGSRTKWRECPRRGPGGSGHRAVAAMPLS